MSTALIVTLAIALRAIIAYVFLPANAGFAADLDAFRFWAADLGANGPWGAYSRGYFLDYLPGYLWILWPLGALSGLVTGSFDPGVLVKLPAIVADGLLILASVRLARELGASTRAQQVLALLLAFAPATWLSSAVWGQVDSVGTSVLIFATTELIRGKTLRAGVLVALAAVIKPQFGILIPILVLLALVRSRRARDPWSVPLVGLAGIAVLSLVALPFGLTVIDVVAKVGEAAGNYPYLSVNAWNLWALADSGGAGLVANGTWGSDIAPLFGAGPPAIFIGTALLLAAITFALRGARHDERTRTVAALAVIAIAFFVLPTRVHERYLFPAVPLTLVLAAALPRWRLIALAVSLVFTLNAWGVLTLDYLQNPGLPDLGWFTDALHTPAAIVLVAAVSVCALFAAGYELLRLPTGVQIRAQLKQSFTAGSSTAAARAAAREVASAQPAPRQRLNRVDLWMLLVIAVMALSLRGWRVGEPTRFHFDEVYHVRTATEFTQFWKYGEPHAIYEYTHPHLAKYAIAAGLASFGAPRVDGRSDYDAPILAIASRPEGATGEPLIWVATARGVDVINPATRSTVGRINAPNSVVLHAATDGSLWGASSEGLIFHTPAAAADGSDASAVQQWELGLQDVHAAVALNETLFVLAGGELLRIDAGSITARVIVSEARDLRAVEIDGVSRIAVAGGSGLTLFNAEDLGGALTTPLPGGLRALGTVDWLDEPRLYAAGSEQVMVYTLRSEGAASVAAKINIRGVTAILPNDATRIVHVVAPGPAGEAAGAALWSIEPNGNAYFADAALGEGSDRWYAPTAEIVGAVIDGSAELPDGGRGELLVAWPDGRVAQVSVGDLPAGWRWPGVIAGAIAAALLALLARLLTERRDVAALVGGLALLDGAGFVQSRIGMNDVYLLVALLAAACAFTAWLQGRGRGPLTAGLLLLLTGTGLGFALASKWVALYGIGALGLLWLVRSPVGRVVAVAGLIGLAALLLPATLATAQGSEDLPNVPFLFVAFATVALATVAAWRAGGLQREGWSLRGLAQVAGGGAEGLLVGATLIALPLAIYVISYLPWAALGNQIVEGWPLGNEGQSLTSLTASMYQYHDTLRVAHAASSPWWAWPFDLKPVWFFQESYAALGGWSGAIYDGGNVASRIIGLAGGAWLALQAWRQRSWGLVSVGLLFLALWLPWARIDRAAFQYHYFPSSQFALIALALLLADLRRGDLLAARFTKLGLGALILAAPLLWALTPALCTAAGVLGVYAESQVCLSLGLATPGPIIGALLLIPATYAAWSLQRVHEPQRIFRWAIGIIALVALLWYPNWSALPLPTGLHNVYQGIIPTWTWSFQFGVTLEKPVDVPLVGGASLIYAALLASVALLIYALLKFTRSRELQDDRAERNAVGRK